MNVLQSGAPLKPPPAAPCCLRVALAAGSPTFQGRSHHWHPLRLAGAPVSSFLAAGSLSWRLPGSRLQRGNGPGARSDSHSGVNDVSPEGKGILVQADSRRWGPAGSRGPGLERVVTGGALNRVAGSPPDVSCCSWAWGFAVPLVSPFLCF